MIIHCTQKLAAKLPEVSTASLFETSPLGSWHAHLYSYDRRQCVLFCHDESRYCLFLAGLVKADFAELGRLHRELFLATLVALCREHSILSVPETRNMTLCDELEAKTNQTQKHSEKLMEASFQLPRFKSPKYCLF
ncbi:MAG: DUF6933 domain-containing protein [Desulfuromonadales bacterium]